MNAKIVLNGAVGRVPAKKSTVRAGILKSRSPARMKEGTVKWNLKAYQIMRDFSPEIRSCADCGGPFAYGYRCTRCGSNNPEGL